MSPRPFRAPGEPPDKPPTFPPLHVANRPPYRRSKPSADVRRAIEAAEAREAQQ